MSEIQSCELSLIIKQLKLSVKFPCKLTFQHAGKALTSEISSNATNVFSVNKDVTLKEQRPKDAVQININLATEKGGNIMAGIIKINLKDISSSEGQNITLSLQKCLDSYATCTIFVKSARLNKSRIKTFNPNDDKRGKHLQDSKFQTKSQAPIMEGIKSRPRYNEAQSFMNKKIAIANIHSPTQGYLKQKALSTVGFKIKDLSFDREELGSRFKHLNRKGQQEDSKTVVTGRWRDTDQMLKATIEANQKSLKMQIAKYKTKYEQSQRNIEQKQKSIKQYKDQISDLNRQVTEKTFLLEQITTKNNHISKLQQINKSLSKQLHQDRNKVIDFQRDIQQQRNSYENKLIKMKQEMDKKQYDLQKQIYQRKQQTKEAIQDGQYKAAQIKKMKVLIEDLERSLQTKTVQWERMLNNEKAEHLKTKNSHQNKLAQINSRLQSQIAENQALNHSIKVGSEAIQKLENKNHHLEDSLKQIEEKYQNQIIGKDKIIEEKKILQKSQEQLLTKLKFQQKQATLKQKQHAQLSSQLNQANAQNKKKILQLVEKSKLFATKIQQLENKCNILTASEQKLKRNLEICQKDLKNSQQNEKSILRNMKAKEQRILQLQKEISEADNKTIMKDTLSKKDMEYKTIQNQKLNFRVSELEKNLEKEKEQNEERRLQLLKNQNKLKMLQQGNNRLMEQIKELKFNWAKRQDQFTSIIAEQNDEIKKLESKQAEFNRNLHNNEMEKMNLKNQISKLQRSIEGINEKFDKCRRRESQLESTVKNLSAELEQRNQQIITIQSDFKILENDYKMLQADKSKHEKITTIISEEKDTIKSDIAKLKKEIQRKDQKQEQYLQQIKGYKENITKIQLKLSTVTKEAEKFKHNITQSLKSAMILKQNYMSMDNVSQTNLELSRSIQRSRVSKNQNNQFSLGVQQSRFGEIIQNISKESQQSIAILADDLRKTRKDKQNLEREVSSLNMRLKETQQQLSKSIKDLSSQIQTIVSRANEDTEDYEQKISQLEKQLQRKQKNINQMVNQMQDITKIHENERSNQDISISDLLNKVESLKYKIVDLERKDQSNSQVFISLEEKITELQQQNFELQHQLQMYSEQLAKKERFITTKSEEAEDILEEFQRLKRLKNQQSVELLALKQSLSVEKENSYRLSSELKAEEQKNQQLKLFQSEILKQKQSFLKKEFEKSQKIYHLEQNIQSSKSQHLQKIEQINVKTKIILEQKETIKQLQAEINNIQLLVGQSRISLEKQKERVKDRQRKITEKDSQIQNLSSQFKKYTIKSEGQLKNLQQELQSLSINYSKDQSAWALKIYEYQSQVKNLKELEKRQSENNISLEQLIFFEKQTNNLHLSKIEELKQEISELEMENNRLSNEIIMLADQIKQKEENLFALSGKLYASDNRIEAKEEQFRQRLEKIQQEWRCKIQQICQEYQHKLQIIQREKNHIKNSITDLTDAIQKLENEKIILRLQNQKQKQQIEAKIKKFEEQKMVNLIEKNKQLERLREVIEQLQEKIKRKQFQLKVSQEERKKTEQKSRQSKNEIQKGQQKKLETIRNLQRQLDQLKRKQGQLKRFKQALKNSQWTTERQIKKSVQNTTKSLANYTSQESKGAVLDIMRSLQSSIAKLVLVNYQQL